MLNNFRSNFLFSRLAFRSDDNLIATLVAQDVYKPIEYIVLDPRRLRGKSTLNWAKNNFGDFGFDFDKYSMLLWPDDDAVPASDVVRRINTAVPKFASVKMISPALAHGLDETASLTFETPDDGQSDTDELSAAASAATQSDINLFF